MAFITQRKHAFPHQRLTTSVGWGTTLLAGLMASSASVADSMPTTSIALPEISITAGLESTVGNYQNENLSSTKFTQPLSKTPQTIQIISQDIIQDQQATTLTEALRNSPGVGTFYAGENGNTSTGDAIYMRGFDTSGSIFVDGVRDLSGVSHDTFDIEQVEVIKGPNGADFGRTAPSGSINLVTKQAKLKEHTEATLSAGTADQKRLVLDSNHKINSTAAVRINVMGENSGVPGRDFVRNRRWGIAPAVAFGLGTDRRLYLDYLHVSQNNTPDGGVVTIGLPGYTSPNPTTYPQLSNAPKVDSSNFYGTTQDHDTANVDRLTAIFEQDFTDGKILRNTTRLGRTHEDYLLSSFMASATYLTIPDINNPATWLMRRLPNFLNQTNTILSNQTGIISTATTGKVTHTFSYGIELSREQVTTLGMGTPLDSSFKPTLYTVNIYDPSHTDPNYYGVRTGADGEGLTQTAALYWFDNLAIGKRWLLTAGLRLDHYAATFSNSIACGSSSSAPACTGPVYTTSPGIDAAISGNLFSWQSGAVYQLTEQGNLYADVATSAQPPGGGTLQFSANANNANNPLYDPQQARTLEAGTKWKLIDNRLLLSAALYRTTVNHQIEQDPVDNQYYQTGEKQVQGIELSAVGQLTRNWNVSAGFTTMDAKVISGSPTSQDGSMDLSYTPSSAFTSWTTYRLPFGLEIGGGARYVGELKRGTDGAIGTPQYTDGYWVVDALASYPVSRHIDVQLNIYNLFNKDYVASINKSGYRYVPGAPRYALLSVKFKL